MCRDITLFCLLVLAIPLFAACNVSKPETPPVVLPPQVETSKSENPAEPQSSDTPELLLSDTTEPESANPWPEPIYGEIKDFTIMLEGMEEIVPMTYTVLDFSHWPGATNVGLYIDRERYACSVFEGEYDIVPVGSGGDTICSLHVFPKVGESSKDVLEETKIWIENGGHGDIISTGTTELDNHTVLYINTSAGLTSYFVDYNGGCIFLSLSVQPEAMEGHGVRMAEMLRTVKVVE